MCLGPGDGGRNQLQREAGNIWGHGPVACLACSSAYTTADNYQTVSDCALKQRGWDETTQRRDITVQKPAP